MKVSMFCFFEFLERIEIPAFICVINKMDSYLCKSLKEIEFADQSELEEIDGFAEHSSIEKIEIARSVEEIKGLKECVKLKRVVLRGDGCKVYFKTIDQVPIKVN
jgi:hypothetical protein